MRVHRSQTRLKCFFCKEAQPPFTHMEDIIAWNEVHSPYWAPAHRKCTDECEREATAVLANMYREAPEGAERDDFVQASVAGT